MYVEYGEWVEGLVDDLYYVFKIGNVMFMVKEKFIVGIDI